MIVKMVVTKKNPLVKSLKRLGTRTNSDISPSVAGGEFSMGANS
jgi:hypothetical protein